MFCILNPWMYVPLIFSEGLIVSLQGWYASFLSIPLQGALSLSCLLGAG